MHFIRYIFRTNKGKRSKLENYFGRVYIKGMAVKSLFLKYFINGLMTNLNSHSSLTATFVSLHLYSYLCTYMRVSALYSYLCTYIRVSALICVSMHLYSCLCTDIRLWFFTPINCFPIDKHRKILSRDWKLEDFCLHRTTKPVPPKRCWVQDLRVQCVILFTEQENDYQSAQNRCH